MPRRMRISSRVVHPPGSGRVEHVDIHGKVDRVFSTEVRDYGIDDSLCAYVIDQVGAEADPEVVTLVNCVADHPNSRIHEDGRSIAYQFWALSSSWSPRPSPARRVRRPACTEGWRDEFGSRASA